MNWKKEQQEIIEKHGKWLSYDIMEENGGFYIDPKDGYRKDLSFIRKLVTIISDFSCKSLKEIRVLDLACLEGLFAIEIASQGAGEVVAVDGRREHIAKLSFASKALGLKNLKALQCDIRFIEDKIGRFNVILCCGIIYHLRFYEIVKFLKTLHALADGIVVIDTHISLWPRLKETENGKEYYGIKYIEPLNSVEDALDSKESFWLTRSSLYNLLLDSGFTSFYEFRVSEGDRRNSTDRITMVVLKNKEKKLRSIPNIPDDLPFAEKDPRLAYAHSANKPDDDNLF